MTAAQGQRAPASLARGWTGVSRRQLQLGLALLWLLDAALQVQPFMFSRGFAHQVIAAAGSGQPGWVAAPLTWTARIISGAPVAMNTVFAVSQLAIAAAIACRRTVRLGLAASIAWSAGVWYLGEGLGGLGSGHASVITGAPGAVLLYALLAGLAWPHGARPRQPVDSGAPASRFTGPAWAAIWAGGAVLQLLPGQTGAAGIASAIRMNAASAPGWLAAADREMGGLITGGGRAAYVAFVAILAVIGAAGLGPPWSRRAAAAAGAVLAAAFWVFGQAFGQISTGHATDPNSGPLLALLAAALISSPGISLPALAERGSRTAPEMDTASPRRPARTVSTAFALAAIPALLACFAAAQPQPAVPGAAMTMPAGAPMPSGMSPATPSRSARMICGRETRANVALLLGLPSPPLATARWADGRYTCTYHTRSGTLILSVQESASTAAARRYLTALRRTTAGALPLSGLSSLGLPAFQSPAGSAAFAKDTMTLHVDATRLSARAGPTRDSRADIAYALATDIIACWRGD